MGNCSFAEDASEGSTVNCTVSIPEGRLYYSNVNFDIGTSNVAKCPIINFSPYYYRRSNTAGFTPRGETTAIDCSAVEPDAKCFGGAAPTLVPEFPKNTGLYFLTGVTPASSYTLPSENKTRWYGGTDHVNYLVTNNLASPNRYNPVGAGVNQRVGIDGLEPNWYGYTITCTTNWARTLYTINLTIQDENEDGDPLGADEYTDWF